MRLLLAFFLLLPAALSGATKDVLTESQVQAVFSELRLLKPMEQGKRYTLRADGAELTGLNDDFLRRRTAAEIKESGLSGGCGDYATLFIARIRLRGFEALLIDSAQISLHSLVSQFDGHVVVAIRRNDTSRSPWWLVDTTALKILARNWSLEEKSFTASGNVFWIGYCGALERYPVHNPEELKQFYAKTLATVPPEFFNRTLYRLTFTVDRSLIDEAGGYLNPRVTRLARDQDEILAKYDIKPERTVAILLVRGADDASGDLKYAAKDGWVARVGLKSACSPGFLSYFEQTIRRHEQSAPR